jgi:hypothetical protein
VQVEQRTGCDVNEELDQRGIPQVAVLDVAGDGHGAAPRRGLARTLLRRVAPFAVSAVILTHYLRVLDWAALWTITKRVDLPLAIAAVALPQLVRWVLGALLIQRTLRWFHGPFDFRPLFWLCGASNILGFVNGALGGGSQLLYQQRRSGMTWTKLLGVLLFRTGLGLWGIGLVMIPATFAVHYYDLAHRVRLNLWVWWSVLIFGVYWLVEAWLNWHHDKVFGLSAVVARHREHEFWSAFRNARPRHWFLTWLMLAPQMLVTLAGYHLLNRAFGINAPLVETFVVLPLALAVMDLPVAFAGFGTATLAWTTFFGAYGSVNDIGALTLFLPMSRILCRALIGVVSLRPAMPEIERLLQAR